MRRCISDEQRLLLTLPVKYSSFFSVGGNDMSCRCQVLVWCAKQGLLTHPTKCCYRDIDLYLHQPPSMCL